MEGIIKSVYPKDDNTGINFYFEGNPIKYIAKFATFQDNIENLKKIQPGDKLVVQVRQWEFKGKEYGEITGVEEWLPTETPKSQTKQQLKQQTAETKQDKLPQEYWEKRDRDIRIQSLIKSVFPAVVDFYKHIVPSNTEMPTDDLFLMIEGETVRLIKEFQKQLFNDKEKDG